ncbi:sulfatase [Candidatus Poribacteria bacterium]|nr:sulfatase [Candidatus Poribacteria bacterium]
MSDRPNVVVLFADQLRACDTPPYVTPQAPMPNMARLAEQGVTFTNMISTCPVCTPYRSMLLTGRHPQTTGHLMNFVRTRHDEIGIGDAFGRAGYRTGWVGKWHLHTGSFPQINGADFVPEGRDRLGFAYWRGYNFHMDYFGGTVNRDDWRAEKWDGYETDALNRYAREFVGEGGDEPFCLFISPHQPHVTPFESAPQEYYDRLLGELEFPANVPDEMRQRSIEAYRDYLAMTLAVDDMLGELMRYLEESGLAEKTLLIFTSDHGTQMGAQGRPAWDKKLPYEESLRVPMMARLPGTLEGDTTRDALTAPVDLFPTLCGLCDVPVPRTVEGIDLSDAWLGREGAAEQDAVFTMNFTKAYDYLVEGEEWRGVRTKRHVYTRWLNGLTELFDLDADPLQMRNLAADPASRELREALDRRLDAFMSERSDALAPCTDSANWFDEQRRIVRNAHGPLGDPEQPPDWSLLS